MAAKTNTDLIRELSVNVVSLEGKTAVLQRNYEHLNMEQDKTAEALHNALMRISVLDERLDHLVKSFAEFKKTQEENTRQRWLLWVAAWGCALTLVANLLVTFLRK